MPAILLLARPPPVTPPPSFKALLRLIFEVLIAGIVPKTKPARTATRAVKRNVLRSISKRSIPSPENSSAEQLLSSWRPQ